MYNRKAPRGCYCVIYNAGVRSSCDIDLIGALMIATTLIIQQILLLDPLHLQTTHALATLALLFVLASSLKITWETNPVKIHVVAAARAHLSISCHVLLDFKSIAIPSTVDLTFHPHLRLQFSWLITISLPCTNHYLSTFQLPFYSQSIVCSQTHSNIVWRDNYV